MPFSLLRMRSNASSLPRHSCFQVQLQSGFHCGLPQPYHTKYLLVAYSWSALLPYKKETEPNAMGLLFHANYCVT